MENKLFNNMILWVSAQKTEARKKKKRDVFGPETKKPLLLFYFLFIYVFFCKTQLRPYLLGFSFVWFSRNRRMARFFLFIP